MLNLKISKIFIVVLLLSAIFVWDYPAVGGHAKNGAYDTGASNKQEKVDYFPFPEPDSGYITDLAYLLSSEDEEEIEKWLWQIESRTKVEIIVVTISSIKDYQYAPNETTESFATGLFNKYKIGNMPDNKGILLLIALKDRKTRIELGDGYDSSRDRDALRIIENNITPHFKRDDYTEGIISGVKAIAGEFASVHIGANWNLILIILSIPVIGLIAFSLFKNGKRGWGWVFIGLLVVAVLAVFYIVFGIIRHMPKSSSSSWGAGGMGGFGGGSSGGGGATGGW